MYRLDLRPLETSIGQGDVEIMRLLASSTIVVTRVPCPPVYTWQQFFGGKSYGGKLFGGKLAVLSRHMHLHVAPNKSHV